jgi:transposase InsO family protein
MFLANHASRMWACDFFAVHALTFKTLYGFFFIGHGRRAIVDFNVTQHPTAEWTWRQMIAATPWGVEPRYVIRDRDACFGKAFGGRAQAIGIETILTPFRAPKANAIAAQMVGTLSRECLDHIIVLNERHLRYVLSELSSTTMAHDLISPWPALRLSLSRDCSGQVGRLAWRLGPSSAGAPSPMPLGVCWSESRGPSANNGSAFTIDATEKATPSTVR